MSNNIPTVGDMLCDEYNTLGMVVEADYLEETNLFLVQIEWYIGAFIHTEVYRIGIGNQKADINYMKLHSYNALRQRYNKLRK